MANELKAQVGRAYRMDEQIVLVLDVGYDGEIGIGERVEITLDNSEKIVAPVKNLAWGSAFHAESPPLTLVLQAVDGLDLDKIVAGSSVIGLPED